LRPFKLSKYNFQVKLLYITNGINGPGGLERVLAIKTLHLAEKHEFEITILGLNNANKNPFFKFSPRINFVNINLPSPKRPIKYIRRYKKGIQQVVDEIQPDIVSVCDNGLKAFLVPVFLKTKAKLIYERHNSRLAQLNSLSRNQSKLLTKAQFFLTEKLAPKFDCFVILTKDQKREWTSVKNLKTIPNPRSFTSNKKADLDKKVIISIGKISYQKGQDLLLQIWNKLQPKHPEWELHLYGEENLSFLNTNDLPAQVKFFRAQKNIKKKYHNSSIYVMSSRYEGFGMVLIEAMTCGLPSVSFACPYGPADILQHGEDGFLVESENLEQMQAYLERLMTDADLRKKMGQKAQTNANRFAVNPIIEKWVTLYKDLVK